MNKTIVIHQPSSQTPLGKSSMRTLKKTLNHLTVSKEDAEKR